MRTSLKMEEAATALASVPLCSATGVPVASLDLMAYTADQDFSSNLTSLSCLAHHATFLLHKVDFYPPTDGEIKESVQSTFSLSFFSLLS